MGKKTMTHQMWAQWKDFRLQEADDHEGQMAKGQLERSMEYSKMILQKIENADSDGDGEVQLPAWVQSKLTTSMEDLQSVHNYLDGKDGLEEDGTYVPGSIKTTHKMNVPMLGYTSPEAKKMVEKDINTMGKYFNKASQLSIKTMMDGVKGGRYDAMDIIQSIKSGPAQDTSVGVRDMLIVLWSKVDKRFRKYLGGKKRRS